MKATFDIPDDLYRGAKARSAMEGRPLRAVAVELFEKWMEGPSMPPSPPVAALPSDRPTRFDGAPWVKISRRYIRADMRHDWEGIRDAVAAGWGGEAAKKLKRGKQP